jgi:hypothetical protein
MRIVMTLLVRDEEDIVDWNLRFHYAQGVDFVVATDNNSADRTPSILERYAKEGRLRLLHEEGDDFDQARWVTRMARLAAVEHAAEWVINSDADEFWWPSRGTLRTTLAEVPPSCGIVRVPRFDFPPVLDEEGRFFERMTARRRHSFELGAPLDSPKVCHRGCPTIVVSQGNHRVSGCQLRTLPGDPPITILHFPARSYAQFATKIAKGGAAYSRKHGSSPDEGGTWKARYAEYLRGELPAYYESNALDGEGTARGLAEGRLVEDKRLWGFLGVLSLGDR